MTTIKQLSVFLENKLGRLHEIMEIIGKADIRIIAAMVADTSEYGILRLITTDTVKAFNVLKEHNVTANLSDVIALTSDTSAGSFLDKLRPFPKEGIGIEYMYCFSVSDKAFLIIRVNDMQKAMNVIEKHGLNTISEQELIKF